MKYCFAKSPFHNLTFVNLYLPFYLVILKPHFQLWLTLAEKYLERRGVDWTKAEKFCFNEWSNPDDDELGMQIVRVRSWPFRILSFVQCDQMEKLFRQYLAIQKNENLPNGMKYDAQDFHNITKVVKIWKIWSPFIFPTFVAGCYGVIDHGPSLHRPLLLNSKSHSCLLNRTFWTHIHSIYFSLKLKA